MASISSDLSSQGISAQRPTIGGRQFFDPGLFRAFLYQIERRTPGNCLKMRVLELMNMHGFVIRNIVVSRWRLFRSL